MPYYSVIRNVVLGDYFTVSRALTRPTGYAELTDAWFSIMTSVSNPAPLIQKHITGTVSLTDGYLINTSGLSESSLLFIIGSGLTQPLYADTTYLYDIQVKDTDNKVYTVETGEFIPSAQVTFLY